jgi:hypothetical protein
MIFFFFNIFIIFLSNDLFIAIPKQKIYLILY